MTGRAILSTNDTSVGTITKDEVFDLLMNARQADWVQLELSDGRELAGAIIFNEFKGTGRLINIDDEISVDFRASEVRAVKF